MNAFALKYVPLKTMEGHVLADFLEQYPCIEVQNPLAKCQGYVQIKP